MKNPIEITVEVKHISTWQIRALAQQYHVCDRKRWRSEDADLKAALEQRCKDISEEAGGMEELRVWLDIFETKGSVDELEKKIEKLDDRYWKLREKFWFSVFLFGCLFAFFLIGFVLIHK